MMQFAKRMEGIKASDIREILKLTENPEVISFAGGVPDPKFFPVNEMREITGLVLSEMGGKVLQYNTTEGFIPLRQAIAARMNKAGMTTRAENIMIISGSQQGLDFSARLFLDKGDAVVCESPSYAGALSAFRAYMPEFIEISTDDEGMNTSELETVLNANGNIKMIYVIPNFQNPTGKSWSLQRRKDLIKLANRFSLPIIEDDPYGDICFGDEKLATLKSMDTEGNVVYLGSFSKTFCPGLRVGWLNAASPVLQKYNIIKQSSDIHTNALAQAEIARYLELYDFEAHLDVINATYKKRRDIMLEAIDKYFPANCNHTIPGGGLFIWVEMPEPANSRDLLLKALQKNVAFIPGETFYPNEGIKNTFRLNYSNVDEFRIEEGIKRLGQVIKNTI